MKAPESADSYAAVSFAVSYALSNVVSSIVSSIVNKAVSISVIMLRKILSFPPFVLFAYLCFCVIISGFALGYFAKIIQEYLAVSYNYKTEALFVLGQVIFQWLFMTNASWSDRKKYAVIALTISMFGSFLLLPLVVFAIIYGVSKTGAIAYFFTVVLIIFLCHHKLIKDEGLPSILTLTWVLYRALLLVYLVKV